MKKIFTAIMIISLFAGFSVQNTASAYDGKTIPIADNLEFSTDMNTAYRGQLAASDIDEDIAYYEVTTGPVKGTIELEADGSFIYTPDNGRKGRDYFGYKAIDSKGNISQEATVIIRINK